MKKILVILILCPVYLIFAQSKKNQIKQLQFTSDSLNRVIDFDRNTNKQKIQELNSAIVNSETKILNQGKSIDSLNSVNRSLNNQLKLKSIELDRINESNTANEKKIKSLQETNAMIQLKISQLEMEKQNKIECAEREEPNDDDIESPKLINTCTFRDLTIVIESTADEKGRYFESYRYLKFNNEVQNSEFFNSKKTELERILNEKFKSEFLKISNNPNSEGCFDDVTYENVSFGGQIDKYGYRYNEINITFNNNQISFHRTFGLPMACLSQEGLSLEFSISELEPYFAK